MKKLLTILLICVSVVKSSIYSDLKHNVLTFLQRANDDYEIPTHLREIRHKQEDAIDAKQAQNKAKILKKARNFEERLNHGKDIPSSKLAGDPKIRKEHYHMDAVLNQLKRRRFPRLPERRFSKRLTLTTFDNESDSTSSSFEMKDWKDEITEKWMQKKLEAINSTGPTADVVNMVAARPWAVPCGDPNQHDMPWGNCMLPMECDAEYRIYRGDYFCGRTQYVCCSLKITNYDMYQGFDLSFADTSFSTDSEEKRAREAGSKENRKRKRRRDRRRREKERSRRKRRIKRKIKKIVREIRKILNKAYRNGTEHRKKRTKLLKRYIKDLKRQYRQDRKRVRDLHLNDMVKISHDLLIKIEQVRAVNKNFLLNDTFREIVMEGSISRQGARMLAEAYPELEPYLKGQLRRDGGGLAEVEGANKEDYLEYDIEYGALYY
ncbi:uncharacterized protein LOC142981042 [Anticarsia gemmatalis]|uniref:uncharacterized protein LOC142981042 n=1 Tax=Anticarsia gemmatalis TaxID=129554 RepID=UPI003F76DB30